MKKKLIAFTVNTLEQAENIILETKTYKVSPILHLKKYFLIGFGVDFILTFREMLISKFGKKSFKLFVDCGFNHGLAIKMSAKNSIVTDLSLVNNKTKKKLRNILE